MRRPPDLTTEDFRLIKEALSLQVRMLLKDNYTPEAKEVQSVAKLGLKLNHWLEGVDEIKAQTHRETEERGAFNGQHRADASVDKPARDLLKVLTTRDYHLFLIAVTEAVVVLRSANKDPEMQHRLISVATAIKNACKISPHILREIQAQGIFK